MAKTLPKWLTRRRAAHLLIAKLAQLNNRFEGWKDARAAEKSRKRFNQNRLH